MYCWISGLVTGSTTSRSGIAESAASFANASISSRFPMSTGRQIRSSARICAARRMRGLFPSGKAMRVCLRRALPTTTLITS